MADNVDITAGAGTTIATDDCTTGQVQLVKLAYGADGNRTHVPADADGVLVNLGANNDVSLNAGTNNIGDVDVLTVNGVAPAFGTGARGATVQRVTIATDDSVPVTNAALQAGANSGAKVEGCTAHDGLDAGNPVKIGFKAVAHGANPTAVAAADRTDAYANRAGVQFVIGGHPNVVTSRVTYAASAQTDIAIGPGTVAPGLKVVVTQIQVTVSNPTTATPSVLVGFGASNTPTTTGVVLSHPGIPGGGGVSRGDGSGILGVGGDGEELRITAGAATGGTLDCVVSYYTIES